VLAPTPPDKIVSAGRRDGQELFLVGRRRLLPRLKGHGGKLWRRWRYPHTGNVNCCVSAGKGC